MKKHFLLLLLLLITYVNVFGKQKFGLDIGIGAKFGLNVNRINGKGWTNHYHTDPHAGFFAHLNKRKIGIQIEAIWSQSSMVTDSSFHRIYKQYYNNILDSLEEGRFRFSMINIPLLINFKLTQKLWIQLGPQFMGNVATADKHKIIKSGVQILEKKNYNFIGGLWYQFGGEAPLLRVNLGMRYVVGLNNMNNLLETSIWKTQMIQLHIGISY